METLTAMTFFLGIAGLGSCLSGALFLVSPDTLSRVSQRVTRTIITLDTVMLRHNAFAGLFLLLGGLVMLYSFSVLIGVAPFPF
jgi:hypothetical protein